MGDGMSTLLDLHIDPGIIGTDESACVCVRLDGHGLRVELVMENEVMATVWKSFDELHMEVKRENLT
jgi:hypothetical protein